MKSFKETKASLMNLLFEVDSTPVLAAGGVVVGSVMAVQLFTSADPIGRCFTFWRQLSAHVSLSNE
jgi:hypothetical protein